MSVADTLRQAAHLIKTHGLAIGDYTDDAGRIDVIEAIWRAATGAEDVTRQARAVLDGDATLAGHNAYRWAMITLQREVGPVARWSDRMSEAEVITSLEFLAGADEGRRVPQLRSVTHRESTPDHDRQPLTQGEAGAESARSTDGSGCQDAAGSNPP